MTDLLRFSTFLGCDELLQVTDGIIRANKGGVSELAIVTL